MVQVTQDWNRIRRSKWSSVKPPPEWDQSLRPISIDGISLFALDDKGNLYWDGQPVETRKRVALTWPQTIGAFLVGLFAIAGEPVVPSKEQSPTMIGPVRSDGGPLWPALLGPPQPPQEPLRTLPSLLREVRYLPLAFL
jgi:hypothetical protein